MQHILFIEMGMGVDMHGHDITRAALRAIQDAIYHNSLPGMQGILAAQGVPQMQVNVRLALPCDHDKLDTDAVRRAFPYGEVRVEVVQGGMLALNAHILPDKGDQNDQMYIVNAAIEVGY